MNGGWMALFEIALVFGAVFAFGFYELYKLKQYRRSKPDDRVHNQKINNKDLKP